MNVSKAKRFLAWVLVFAVAFTTVFTNGITAEAANPKAVKSVKIKIGNKTVTKKTYTLEEGKSATLKVSVSPSSAKKSVAYKTSNKKVATVSKKGKVTAKKAGTAKITVTVTGKNKKKKSTWVKVKVGQLTTEPVTVPVPVPVPVPVEPTTVPVSTTEKDKQDQNKDEKPAEIPVSSVVVTANDSNLYVNNSVQLTATVSPEDATNQKIAWTSSDEKIAKVDETGKVTGIAEGEVTIIATAGGKSGTIKFTVAPEPKKEVAVTAVSASADATKDEKGVYTILVSQFAQITPVIEPADATYQAVNYTSSDEKLLKVDANGKVTAVAEGNAIVTVEAGGKTAELSFNIVPNEFSVSLDKVGTEFLSLKEGYSTSTLTATVIPSTFVVKWTASAEGIVDIESGATNTAKVTAKAPGKVTVTATVGNASASIDYVVVAADDDYVLFTSASGIAEGSYEFTVNTKYKFSPDSVTDAALSGSTIKLINTENEEKVFTAEYKSLNGDTATYAVNPNDFVVEGNYGAQNGTYKLSYGTGNYTIESETDLTINYTEKKYANRIAGRVTDWSTGEAISDVNVKTAAGFSATTDENGYYNVPSTNGDEVTVTFMKDGYFDENVTTMVGSLRTSVVNPELYTYNPEELVISGTIKATDFDNKDVFENGFIVELQAKNNDGDFETISTIETVSETSDPAKTLTYKFGNIDSGVDMMRNAQILPEELSITSTGTYQIIITNGIDENKTNPIYTKTVKKVTTSKTAKEYTVELANMKQVAPLSSLKIAPQTFSFAEGEGIELPENGTQMTFKSIKLYTTNGTLNADVLLASAENVTIETKASQGKIYTNKDTIDLLANVFGTNESPAVFEFPKTDKDNRYYLVFEQNKNAYAVVEVVVSAAGADVVIDTMDSFQVGYSDNEAAGYKLGIGYDKLTESKNAIIGETQKIHTIDGDYAPFGDDLKVDFNIYQVIGGVNVQLGTSEDISMEVDDSQAISADSTFSKLSSEYKYVAVPSNDYLEDVTIEITPGKTNTKVESNAVANVGEVVVPLATSSKLGDTVFVNSIKLVDADDTTKVIATKVVNDDVDVEDGKLIVSVADKFTKIPNGSYKVVYDISNYEPLTTEASYTLVGFEQTDITVADKFVLLAKTGIQGSILCNDQKIETPLYAILLNSDNKIAAAQMITNSSYSLIDTQNYNDIDAGTYKLIIRGEGYNTFTLTKTLTSGVTTQMDDIKLTEGARGNVQLYATCNGQKITEFNANVVAYDKLYVEPTIDNCLNEKLYNKVSNWNPAMTGAYEAYSAGEYYETGACLSYQVEYNVVVTGTNLAETTFKASISSNNVNNILTLSDKTVDYVAPPKTTKLKLTYGVTGDKEVLTPGKDYIVLKDADGNYVETLDPIINYDSASSRTVYVNIPTGFTGTITVYANGAVTLGVESLDNYNTESNLNIPLYELSNN